MLLINVGNVECVILKDRHQAVGRGGHAGIEGEGRGIKAIVIWNGEERRISM